ncbi:hypothetical protein VB005_03531 [Metarhizium brunneum]
MLCVLWQDSQGVEGVTRAALHAHGAILGLSRALASQRLPCLVLKPASEEEMTACDNV